MRFYISTDYNKESTEDNISQLNLVHCFWFDDQRKVMTFKSSSLGNRYLLIFDYMYSIITQDQDKLTSEYSSFRVPIYRKERKKVLLAKSKPQQFINSPHLIFALTESEDDSYSYYYGARCAYCKKRKYQRRYNIIKTL